MSYAEYQPLRLPDGFKLFYYPRQDAWAVVLPCRTRSNSWAGSQERSEIPHIKRISPPHKRTFKALKDWIEEHWEDLENVARLSRYNLKMMDCVIKDLRTGVL